MAHGTFRRNRRALLIGTGALAAASATGLWAWDRANQPQSTDVPQGWYLLSRQGVGNGERQLVVRHTQSHTVKVLEAEFGTRFLSAVISPDTTTLAVLKRVARGSMPTDAVALYDIPTFRRLSVVEVQVAFQRIPTYMLSWSADSSHLAIPYNLAGRTLLFRVHDDRKVSLQSMYEHASFQFHPTHPNMALYTATPPALNQVSIVQLTNDIQETPIESFVGMDAQWSPDGSKLAYRDTLGTQGTERLLIRDEATKQVRVIPIEVERLTWSSDSRRLAVYGLVNNDLLNIRQLVPANILPNWQPANPYPAVFIYDTANDRMRSIRDLRAGFQLASMQWLQSDWLLVIDVQARYSFVVAQSGDPQLPISDMDNYTPLLLWIPQG